MRDNRAPTLDYRPPDVRWTTRRWILVWLPMSVALIAIAFSVSMGLRYQAAQRELAIARALQASAFANQQLAQQVARLSAQVKGVAPTTQAVEQAEPVAAIWTQSAAPRGWPRNEGLIVGVWSDGTIVWRVPADNATSYRFARVSKERVDQLLRDLDAAGFFGSFERTQFWGPDAGYMVIAGKFGEKQQWFGSWHDSATTRPANPNVVITETGIHALQSGQPRPQPSEEYQRFVDAWTRAKGLIEAIVPAEGEPIDAIDLATFQSAFPHK